MKHAVCPIAICLVLLLGPALARAAATCEASDRPVVEFKADVKPPDQVIADALARQLTAELEARGIDLCAGSAAPRRPIGRVLLQVERTPQGPTRALIRIGDEVTDKRVERTMDLTALPPDSQPLSVAAAADELLRASWAELLMKDAPPPSMPPPEAIVTAVNTSLKPMPPAAPQFELGVVINGSTFSERAAIGAGLLFGRMFSAHFGFVSRVGLERGRPTSGEHGKVSANATSLIMGLEYIPWLGNVGLRFGGDVRLLQVQYVTEPSTDNVGHDAADWAIVSGWGARVFLDTGSVRTHLGATGLIGLRPSSAADAGQTVSSIGRLGGEITLGVSLRL